MSRFAGLSVIVTGGSRGIGEAIVRRLAEEGAKVFATYNSNSERAVAIAAELTERGQFVEFIQADVLKEEDVKSLVEKVMASGGRIDGLINNAGITRDNLLMRMSLDDWNLVLQANLTGIFLTCKHVSRTMMSQRKGRIVNLTSVVGLTGNAGQANYAASKAGIIGFSKSLAKELASRNILVNCVAPGYVETDMTQKLTDEQRSSFLEIIPLRRAAKPEDIASVVAFLLSEDANYITGQILSVDGGMHM